MRIRTSKKKQERHTEERNKYSKKPSPQNISHAWPAIKPKENGFLQGRQLSFNILLYSTKIRAAIAQSV